MVDLQKLEDEGGSTMREYYPLIVVGGVIGLISIVFSLAYALIKNKKETIGFDRNMKDGEIVRRLLAYARPHWRSFGFAGLCMAFFDRLRHRFASPHRLYRGDRQHRI